MGMDGRKIWVLTKLSLKLAEYDFNVEKVISRISTVKREFKGVVVSIKSISPCLTLNRNVTDGQPRNTSFYFRK